MILIPEEAEDAEGARRGAPPAACGWCTMQCYENIGGGPPSTANEAARPRPAASTSELSLACSSATDRSTLPSSSPNRFATLKTRSSFSLWSNSRSSSHRDAAHGYS